jgi:hypothetical protein
MSKFLLVTTLVVMMMATGADAVWAKANSKAPCIGENASSFAPVLRGDFGQEVVSPEARAGETGEVASGAAHASCD